MRSIGLCPFCGQGELGLRRCRDGRIVALCDECELIWSDPLGLVRDRTIDPEDRSSLAECKGGRWASDEEVAIAGLTEVSHPFEGP